MFYQNHSLTLYTVKIFCNLILILILTDERRLALFPARTIVRDPHYRESPTYRKQDLNLHRT